MELKSGVRLSMLSPQMVLAFMVIESVCDEFRIPFVITSCNDGKHSQQSKHYAGMAGDVRTKFPEIDGREMSFRDEVKRRLGQDFDVVMEAVGTDNEHLHVEYDPKG